MLEKKCKVLEGRSYPDTRSAAALVAPYPPSFHINSLGFTPSAAASFRTVEGLAVRWRFSIIVIVLCETSLRSDSSRTVKGKLSRNCRRASASTFIRLRRRLDVGASK